MTFTLSSLQPIVALGCGIAVLIWPKILNYIVAGYLIFSGLIGLGILNL